MSRTASWKRIHLLIASAGLLAALATPCRAGFVISRDTSFPPGVAESVVFTPINPDNGGFAFRFSGRTVRSNQTFTLTTSNLGTASGGGIGFGLGNTSPISIDFQGSTVKGLDFGASKNNFGGTWSSASVSVGGFDQEGNGVGNFATFALHPSDGLSISFNVTATDGWSISRLTFSPSITPGGTMRSFGVGGVLVPEPSSAWLTGLGLLGLLPLLRRRRRCRHTARAAGVARFHPVDGTDSRVDS